MHESMEKFPRASDVCNLLKCDVLQKSESKGETSSHRMTEKKNT